MAGKSCHWYRVNRIQFPSLEPGAILEGGVWLEAHCKRKKTSKIFPNITVQCCGVSISMSYCICEERPAFTPRLRMQIPHLADFHNWKLQVMQLSPKLKSSFLRNPGQAWQINWTSHRENCQRELERTQFNLPPHNVTWLLKVQRWH